MSKDKEATEAKETLLDLSRESHVAVALLTRPRFRFHVYGDPEASRVAHTILSYIAKGDIVSDTLDKKERVVLFRGTGSELIVSRETPDRATLSVLPFSEMYPSILISNKIEYGKELLEAAAKAAAEVKS